MELVIRRHWMVLIAAAWLGAAHAAAQPTVTLRAGQTAAYVGEVFTLYVEVKNCQDCPAPQPPTLDQATLQQVGDAAVSSRVIIINGRRDESYTQTYTYELTPQVPGALTIPPFTVQSGDTQLTTRAMQLDVQPSNANELFFAEVTVPVAQAYVGQRLTATLLVWIEPATWGGRVLDAGTMLDGLKAVNFGPFPPRRPNQYERRTREVDGKSHDYYVYAWQADVIVDRPGPLPLGDIQLGLVYPDPGGNRDLRARAQLPPLTVQPVPMAGRPVNFNGAVGLFDIEVQATPRDVRVGDPIELTIDIFGEGPIETLPPPLLAEDPQLVRDFRVPRESLAGEMVNQRRRFVTTIRAARDDVTEIPAIEYPYFDPVHTRFVTARSRPIPIHVSPAAEVKLPLATESNGGHPTTAPHRLDGLHDILSDADLLLAQTPPPKSTHLLAVLLGPPILFAATWLVGAFWRRPVRETAGRRKRQAARMARARLAAARRESGPARAAVLAAAITHYVADRLALPPGQRTGGAIIDVLRTRNVPPAVATQVADLIARCEAAAFGGQTAEEFTTLEHAAEICLTTLEGARL